MSMILDSEATIPHFKTSILNSSAQWKQNKCPLQDLEPFFFVNSWKKYEILISI